MEKSTNVNNAAYWLEKNNVIAIPTETVYGLAANIFNKEAIQSIYKIKGRPSNNPLIVHIKSVKELYKYASDIPVKANLLANAFWPGPLTLVLNKTEIVPNYITSNKETVAIRVPNHLLTLKLLEQLDFPIAAPSANPSNRISATTAEHVENYFQNQIPFVLDGGACKNGLESTIVGFEMDEPIVYRVGALAIERIETVIGKVTIKNKVTSQVIVPGMFSKHYSPLTPFYVVNNPEEFIKESLQQNIVFIGFNERIENAKIKHQFLLSEKGNITEAASNLYKTLFLADELQPEIIVSSFFPEEDLGITINDRLKRASINNQN